MASHETLESRVRRGRLYDRYRSLLTEKQRRAYELHDLEDWSLSEVAESLEVSRQGAHDLITRARERMDALEGQLGIERRERFQEKRNEALGALLKVFSAELPAAFLSQAEEILRWDEEDSGEDEPGAEETGIGPEEREDRHV